MQINQETITPDMARDILAASANFRNRPLMQKGIMRGVEAYASAMKENKWDCLNGETIKFDVNGTLIDGWHRLNAVVLAGVPVSFLVVRGLPTKCFETIDIGLTRKLSDMLYSSGIISKYPKQMAVGARKLITYIVKGTFGNDHLKEHTLENCKKIIDAHPLLEDAARFYGSSTTKIISQGVFYVTYVAVKETDENKGDDFIYAVTKGAGLSEDNPCYWLREYLIRMRNMKGVGAISQYHEGALVVKAWNLFQAGKKCKLLRYNSKEDYPHFYGWNPIL